MPLPTLTVKALTVRGSLTGTLQGLRNVVSLAEGGKLGPMPIATTPLDDANEALQRLLRGDAQRRLVLES